MASNNSPVFPLEDSSENHSKHSPQRRLDDIPADFILTTLSVFDVMVAPNLYGDILSYVSYAPD